MRISAIAILVALFPAAGFAQTGPDVIVGALTGAGLFSMLGIGYAYIVVTAFTP